MSWCKDNIEIVEGRNPQNLRTSPIAVWHSRKADAIGFKIFYVALCRTLGIEAEMDLVTGSIEKTAPQAFLKPMSDKYFRDYTLTMVGPDGTLLLDYEETGLPDTLSVDEGYYLLTTGRRLADGSVLVGDAACVEGDGVDGGDEADLVYRAVGRALRRGA